MVTVDDIISENIDRLTVSKRSKKDATDIMRNWDGYQFEKFWAELKRRDGYAARATRESGDRGVDVVAALRVDSDTRRITLAQTKCYSGRVSAHDLEKYDYLTNYAHEVEFVTTADYSHATEERAYELGFTLVGPDEIYELVRETNSWDLLTEDPFSTALKPAEPRSVDTLIGIAFGAGNIAHRGDQLRPLDPNLTPREAFIEAIRALFRHGFIESSDLRDRENGPFVFIRDMDEIDAGPNDIEDSVLIPILEESEGSWCVRLSGDHPEDLFYELLKIIRFIASINGINIEEPNSDAASWYWR